MFMQLITDPQKRVAADRLIDAFDSKFFKTMSEPVRMQIMRVLLLNGRSDIATIADNMPQDRSVISRHLNLMSEVGILKCEKEARHMFYEIDGNVFLNKLENMTRQIRNCMPLCCPDCLK